MGFYIRKSIRVGPLRFNLSKSGIGVSAGIKGFRVGTGPRGHYVHAGRGGIYYRATVQDGPIHKPAGCLPDSQFLLSTQNVPSSTEYIESTAAIAMVDHSSASLLAELNDKFQKTRLWPFVFGVAMPIVLYGCAIQNTLWLILGIFLIIITMLASYWDQNRKTTVLFYELQAPVLPAFEALHMAFERLLSCQKKWHIAALSKNSDIKYTSGAHTTAHRSRIYMKIKSPPYLKTNIPIFSLPAGKQQLYFLPDKILVYDNEGIGGIPYNQITIKSATMPFIERGGVPSDTMVIDRTWKYVNKNGGPDRRFRDNPEYPVVLYEELNLKSPSGLNEMFQLSCPKITQEFIAAISTLTKALNETQTTAPTPIDTLVSYDVTDNCSTLPESCELSGQTTTVPELNAAPKRPTTESSDAQRYYYYDDSVRGPMSATQLEELALQGRITQETQVCSAHDQSWISFGQLRESWENGSPITDI